jgi:2'-5' RNA ligase
MFVAVAPPEDVLAELSEFLEPRQDADPELRWTHPEQWHVTLAFMPAVADRNLDRLIEGLEQAAAKRQPFQLALAGAGAFPDPARAKLLWQGIAGEVAELAGLAQSARNAANSAGTEVDGATFRPHLSVARLNRPRNVSRWLRIFDTYYSQPWTVENFELIESHLGQGPGGRPRYQVREQFQLTAVESPTALESPTAVEPTDQG